MRGGLREEGDSGSRRMAARSPPGQMNFSFGRTQLAPQVPEQEGRLGGKTRCQPLACAQSLLLGAPLSSPGSLGMFHSLFEKK